MTPQSATPFLSRNNALHKHLRIDGIYLAPLMRLLRFSVE
jgi:hypothetical protein